MNAETQTLAVVGSETPTPVRVVTGPDWSVIIPLIMAGLGILLGQVLTYLKSRSNGVKADAIHVLVNSGMTKALADLAKAQEEIRTLRDLVTALNARVVRIQEASNHQASDAARLPSAEVLAAQASTPITKAPWTP